MSDIVTFFFGRTRLGGIVVGEFNLAFLAPSAHAAVVIRQRFAWLTFRVKLIKRVRIYC